MATIVRLPTVRRSSPPDDEPAEVIRRALDRENVQAIGRAGCGKTATLCSTASALEGAGRRPLALTFGHLAAAELRARGVVRARTFDSQCGGVAHAAEYVIAPAEIWRDYNLLRRQFFGRLDRATTERCIAIFRDGGLGLSASSPMPFYDPTRSLAAQPEALALVERFLDQPVGSLPYDIDVFLSCAHGFVEALIASRRLPLGWACYLVAELRLGGAGSFDALLIDEVQDLNGAQIGLVRHLAAGGRQVLGFGDNMQSIMFWRGAHPTAMQALADDHGMGSVLMSRSWRCARAIAQHAATLVPDFTTHRSDEGEVLCSGYTGPSGWQPGDLLLCRVTAPIYALAFEAHAAGHSVRLAPALIARVKRIAGLLRDEDLASVARSSPDHLGLPEDDGDVDESLTHTAISLSRSLLEAGVVGMNDAPSWVEKNFSGNAFWAAREIRFSSIHAAKGAEARRVCIIDPWRSPSARALSPVARQQEANLSYVARTRACDELVYVTVNPPPHWSSEVFTTFDDV